MPNLLYATEACPLLSRDINSLDFTITRALMKIFGTGSAANIADYQRIFNFLPGKHQIKIRTAKFLQRFTASENPLCLLFNDVANQHLNAIFTSVDVSVNSIGSLVDTINEQFHSFD